MNVLLTCAGRRNYLVKFFQNALGKQGKVLVGDVNPCAPALAEADLKFILPPVDDPCYIENLLVICRRYSVGLLISVNDLELPVLAPYTERFRQAGTILVVSAPQIVATCLDKWATYQCLKACGLATPRTYLSLVQARQALAEGEISFPLVIKPRWGSGSLGVEYPEDDEELELAYKATRLKVARSRLAKLGVLDQEQSLVIQEKLLGCEYGLDIINDLKARYRCTFVRQKLEMRAGETSQAITLRDARLEQLGRAIGQNLEHLGILDCDVLVTKQEAYVLDLNPRFGGGYPFSHVAGADLPGALIAWARGKEPETDWMNVTPDMSIAKCDRLVVVESKRGLLV
jgi:carbamoyl-phosphate synthase large subunit